MRAAAFVGRVGGLAVAFGVGAAAVSGVASADTPPPSDTPSLAADPPPTPVADSTTAHPSTTHPSTTKYFLDSATATSKRLLRHSHVAIEKDVAGRANDALSGGYRVKDLAPTMLPEDDEVVTTGAARQAAPAPPTVTRIAQRRTMTTRSLRRIDPTTALASVAEGTAESTAVHRAETVLDRVDAAAETPVRRFESVVTRAADTVIASTRPPAMTIQAAEPLVTSVTTAPAMVTGVLSGVLSVLGLSPLAVSSPLAPVEPAALVALLAWGSRREIDQSAPSLGPTTTTAAPAITTARAVTPAAAVAVPATTRIGWITGAGSINDTERRFGIAGTDVGVMWDNGITGDNPATQIVEQREILMAFGDTFSGPNMTGVWRNNVLLRSADGVLSNGLYVPDGIVHDPGAYSGSPMSNPNFSREIIGKYGYAVGPEVTIIPTAAISVPGAGVNGATRQYVQFMSVRSWDTPGRWTTNYSGMSYSDDNGQNWTVVPASSIRPAAAGRSTMPYVAGNENFQQGAFVKPPAGSPEAAAGWVYAYGTPAGRGGTVYLSRVNQNDILDQTKYEYWNGSTWVRNKPSAATPVLPGTTTSSFFGLVKRTTYPTAGEMSVQYNPYLKQYVMLYADSNNNVVMRTSPTPQGTWSAPKTLVTSTQYPGLYAPMIHPWSGTSQLKKADGTPEDPQYLYWGLSQWNEYNVALMRTDLSKV